MSVPKDILHRARILAVRRNQSLSSWLTQALVELVSDQEEFERARQRNLAMLNHGFDLGTHGQVTWKREDLHDR